jgi:hypothetical protein
VYRPWRPDRRGRWHSAHLGIAIGLEGVQVAVYAPNGRRQLREGEIHRELARRDEQHARALEEERSAREQAEIGLARLRAELERLRQERNADC